MNQEFEEFRMGHLSRTAEIWKQLLQHGVTEETPLDFDFHFQAPSKVAAESLIEALSTYNFKQSSKGWLKKEYSLSSSSGPITWTEEVLLKWVDYLIATGEDHRCEFDGCGASIPSVGT